MSIAYLNGTFLPLEEAHVPVLDRGFIFGDGVYEVIPVYSGRLFRLDAHLRRLNNSLDSIRLSNPMSNAQWAAALEQVVAENGGGDQSIYLQVTRGVAKRKHNFPDETHHTVFIMSDPLVDMPPSEGVKAITLDDIRWQLCHVKSIALLGGVLLRQQAVEQGAAESILLREGYVTEGAASNVFVIKDGAAFTPPEGPFILTGITRDLIIESMQAANLTCKEAQITEAELRNADEIWLTSSTREILPVVELDGKPVGNGQIGTVWQQAWDLYQDYKKSLRAHEIK
ncbi:D-amino acid aminotransferase [Candidatus Albibeggiatoa sp. nov. NOAA]|uniref:D-amino acid aminotransferase n=1 Tax=Candidatus Albibeggiatoa sp. nov. NOAA TaxID=3162724 RepID=UPI003300B683|nr:D-amino acid aminotransferase [Thiotrichaceae bacterium]